MLAEIGGDRIQLESRRKTVKTLDLENRTLYAAAVSENGTVAAVVDSASQSYVCGVQVYNSRGKLLYEYKSTKYLITNISLSPNGRRFAALGTSAEAGALQSVLLVFDLEKENPTEYTGTDILLYDVVCFEGGCVLAAGDTECWQINATGQRTVTPLDGMELLGFSATSKAAGVVLRQSGSAGSGEVWLMDNQGAVVRTHRFVGTYRHISCRDDRILVLTDDTLFSLSATASDVQVNTPSDSLMATEFRGDLMVLTLSHLRQVWKG